MSLEETLKSSFNRIAYVRYWSKLSLDIENDGGYGELYQEEKGISYIYSLARGWIGISKQDYCCVTVTEEEYLRAKALRTLVDNDDK